MRIAAAILLVSLSSATAALAAASSGPFPMPEPDSRTKTMSRYEAQLWVFDLCMNLQSGLMGTTREAVHSPCSCYAKRTVNQMNKSEFEFFRANSVFDDTTREKALANIDACKLKRPI